MISPLKKREMMFLLLLGLTLILPELLWGQYPKMPNMPTVPQVPSVNNNKNNNNQNQYNQRPMPSNMRSRPSMRRSRSSETSKTNEKSEKKQTFDEQYEKANSTTIIKIDHDQYKSSDNVYLTANFHKGEAKEETIPVILLHGMNGSRKDMEPLAMKLAGAGMAVLVPDLRGHGDSIRRQARDFSYGSRSVNRNDNSYTVDKFTQEDYMAMINIDGRFWYSFLISEHNKKHLNIRKLMVVGSDLGAAIACGWVQNDWSVSGSKNGHFAKGLILISPSSKQCNHFAEGLSKERSGDLLGFLGFVGNLSESNLEDMKTIQEKLGGKQAANTPVEKKRFPVVSLQTEKQGVELLTTLSFGVGDSIKKFIDDRMERSSMKNMKWQEIN